MSTIKNASWLEVKPLQLEHEMRRLQQVLHEGEAAAIALAKELHADYVLIDESEGRAIATAEGLRVIGLLGVLLEDKNKHLILKVRPIIDKLISKSKFWLSENICNQIIRLANED